ncbi:hypothetical protein [Bradyrhizobium sp. Tv2a-2]|uniref:hypothetical protein n=1 Tax=Bradyrhizobium sp. Tv2a-2 TaxID=113395 RepID=UPI000418E52B|nr:hypothetical protein [Bradyrhizobium sp. Tv2a-2]
MDRVAQMIVGEFWEMGRQTTRLFTGHIAMAANMETSASDYFSIDVVETPEAILSLASHDGETSRG